MYTYNIIPYSLPLKGWSKGPGDTNEDIVRNFCSLNAQNSKYFQFSVSEHKYFNGGKNNKIEHELNPKSIDP